MASTTPPQVGVPISKDGLNAKLGAATQSLRKAAVALEELQRSLAPYDAAQLAAAYGFTPEEANLYLSCLRGAKETPALLTTVDGFEFIQKTWGA